MPPEDCDAIRDMLNAAGFIVDTTARRTLEDLQRDETLQRAVQHAFIILGEAAKRVAVSTRDAHPGIAWAEVAGMRDVLVHAYHRVSLALLWETALHDVPPLQSALAGLLSDCP
jgi:uncharacterized protein with HEPN domain